MDIVVTARHTEVPGRFRRHLDEKLAKVGQLAPRAQRLDVAVSHEVNKRQASTCERIELTLHGTGPVVRAEACADDQWKALDLATTKLLERLRRASDRRKVHHSHHARPGRGSAAGPAAGPAGPEPDEGVTQDDLDAAPGAAAAPQAAPTGAPAAPGPGEWVLGESPVVIRDKVHRAPPMGLEDALEQMELVGHDFYLFVDAASGCPSVVYRRRGWSYGVLRLDASPAEPDESFGADEAPVRERTDERVGAAG